LVLKLISQNYFYGDIEKAYLAKEQYNSTRIYSGDWNPVPNPVPSDLDHT
jgi:hypothetical protein